MKQFLIIPTLLTLLLASCTKNFETINTDPNRVNTISPGTLLNPILYEVSSFNMRKSDDFTFGLMQDMLPFPSTSGGVHRYDITETAGNSTWTTYYRWLTNVKEMYTASVQQKDPNYQAIALTLNAMIYANLTDCFGDIPMEEATKGDEGIFRPKFTTQQKVYEKIIADLDSANNLYMTTRTMIHGTDILYANNVTSWKRFTNSLQMRILLRLSKRNEMGTLTKLKTIIDNPTKYPVFSSNDQAAIVKLSGVTPFVSPWGRAIDFTTFRAAGIFFTDKLNDFNDPRRARLLTQARNKISNANIGYMGIPSGYAGSDNQFDYIPSNMNIALVTAPMNIVLMNYSEVELIKAEIEFRNSNTSAAKVAYENGVKASIQEMGIVMPADYFTNTKASYNGTLERIMLQKYFALFFTDFQQWFEYRRTGFPVMPKTAGMLNNQIMPVRYRYPPAVQSTNTTNYNLAVSAMGGDNINIKVWWEK
ncbi:MAG: SusD/RagB family nutrient-binding outer membrane lipoprotein [Chitinophagaceae bacterium]|nr:SusD/RagB family nutrient-binding outer membrane lipoprotein [Chitinophagaceae bacterium]